MNEDTHADMAVDELPQRSAHEGRYAWVGVSLYLFALIVIGWFAPPAMVLIGGVLGIWLVAGSGHYWLRLIVVPLVLFPPLALEPQGAGLGGLTFGWTVLFTFLTQRFIEWFWRALLPRTKFTLWDLAGLILLCGVLFGLGRLSLVAYEGMPADEFIWIVIYTLYPAVCCAVVGFPFLIPSPLRTSDLKLKLSGVLFVLVPLLASAVAAYLYNPILLIVLPVLLALLNILGVFFLVIVLGPMQLAGMFATYEMTEEKSSS